MRSKAKTYRAGFKGPKGVVKYVGKPKMSGQAAYDSLKKVQNLRQYKGMFGFVAQNLSFNTITV